MVILVAKDCSKGTTIPCNPDPIVTKNKNLRGIMNLGNNNIYGLKSYLKFFKWVADKMQSY